MLTKKIAVLSLCLGMIGPVYATESYQDLSREYNLVFQDFLRERIQKLPKLVVVEVLLKSGKRVNGTFESFCKYDDGIWIMPLGKHGLFADEAYDISEIQDIRLIILQNI